MGPFFYDMRRASGMLLNDAWHIMTADQRKDVADEVATHVKTLTQHTSSMLETIDGNGVQENNLIGFFPLHKALDTPSWKPNLHPRYTPESFAKHLVEESNMTTFPDIGSEFVLHNSFLSPYNILVRFPMPGQKGQLARIIDWRSTAYWPRYWVATSSEYCRALTVQVPGKAIGHWHTILRDALVRAGFECPAEWYDQFDDATTTLRNQRAGPEWEDWVKRLRLDPNAKPNPI